MQKLKLSFLLAILVAATRLLQAQTIESYTFTTNRLVPDGDASGLSDVRSVPSAIGQITSLSVRLKITGEFNGDIYGYLRHSSGFTVLLNRPGKTATNDFGYADSGFNVTFQTGATNGDVHIYENIMTPAAGFPLTGFWQPDGRNVDPATVTDASPRTTSLTNFNNLNATGTWTLYLADVASGGTNMLTEWGIDITGSAYPTLIWPNPADIVYGAPLGGSQLNATATHNSTNVPGTFSYSTAVGAILAAGLGQTLSVTFTPTDTNSFVSITTNVTINVAQAPLTITAVNANTVYGATPPTLTASYSGFVNGDSASSLGTAVTLSTAATGSSPVGAYNITASGAAGTNYSITDVNGTLTIASAALTMTAVGTSKFYGAALPTLTTSYSGFVNGDTAASLSTGASLSTTANASSPVGTYSITIGGAIDSNYSIAFVNGALTVTPAALAITAVNTNKAYGATLPALTASYNGFVNGDTAASLSTGVTLSTTALASSPVGSYTITPSGAVGANYSITDFAGTLTITQSLSSSIIVSSANPSLPGTNVTFTMTLIAVAPGAGTPSGTVNFRIDGSVAASGVLSGGVARFTTNNLALGSHTVAAEYAGDLNFVGATNALAQNQLIDTPPVAGGVTIVRYPTESAKVLLTTLLASDSNPDGGTLNIVVSFNSANGATISESGGWVFYTPPVGFTNADSFTYTVTDSNGVSAVGTVTVAILVNSGLSQNLFITNLGNGSILITGNGIPAYTYRLQYSPTLVTPNWQDIIGGSLTADSTGQFGYTDTPGGQTRFYRTVYP
jgi:subtilisin-like proprotein convertase family protein